MKVSRLPRTQAESTATAAGDEGGLELGRLFAVLRRKSLLILSITSAVALLAQLKTLTDEPIYTAGFEILTKSVTVENQVVSSVPQTLSSREQGSEAATATLDATKIRVLQSPAILNPLVEQLQPQYPQISYEMLAQNLKVTTSQPDILAVSFRDGNPALVKDVLSRLSNQYLEYSLEKRQGDVRQGLVFVEDQLPTLETLVARQQAKLQTFRQQYNLIDPQLQAQQLSAQIGELAQSRLDTQTKLSEARLLFSEMQNELQVRGIEQASASALSDSPRYQKLLDQLLEVDSQFAKDSTLYLESSPDLQVLQEQRQNLLPLLQREGLRAQREAANRIQDLENRSRAVDQSGAVLNSQVKQLSFITREYSDIQRELQIATDNLNQFLTKREGLRIEAAQREVPWQLLTPPNMPTPQTASAKRQLVLGAGLGFLLGIAAALLSERLSNRIHAAKEIKEITNLPLLGVIPVNRLLQSGSSRQATLSDSLLMADHPFQTQISLPFQEAFRTLYANLRFISPDTPIRSLVVSSPTSDAGKTTVALYLAQAAAAAGRRVLLVDADLRRPRLHQYLQMSASPGLTDVVSSGFDLMNVVRPVAWESNLSLLSCGSIPPDATRILASQSMQQFMAKALATFDLVIYDMPPLLGLSDAYFLAPHTDGLLLIVRLHQLKRVLLEQAIDELQVPAVPILGTVATASDEATGPVSYYQPNLEPLTPANPIATFKNQVTHQSKQLIDRLRRPHSPR